MEVTIDGLGTKYGAKADWLESINPRDDPSSIKLFKVSSSLSIDAQHNVSQRRVGVNGSLLPGTGNPSLPSSPLPHVYTSTDPLGLFTSAAEWSFDAAIQNIPYEIEAVTDLLVCIGVSGESLFGITLQCSATRLGRYTSVDAFALLLLVLSEPGVETKEDGDDGSGDSMGLESPISFRHRRLGLPAL
jgi:hypothetical protein